MSGISTDNSVAEANLMQQRFSLSDQYLTDVIGIVKTKSASKAPSTQNYTNYSHLKVESQGKIDETHWNKAIEERVLLKALKVNLEEFIQIRRNHLVPI